jgi:hypothetical protein
VPNLDADERALLRSVDRGEWTVVAGLPAARARYARAEKATTATSVWRHSRGMP